MRDFPDLPSSQAKKISDATTDYNCIAWAAGDASRWWDPSGLPGSYWPPEAIREWTITGLVSVYETLGYQRCEDDSLENEIEKVAIFSVLGVAEHAARQLPDGRWTSKLGDGEDIEHDLRDVNGPLYGWPSAYLKRNRR